MAIQILRIPEPEVTDVTPPLPKDVKDMIDKKIEIVDNKEELVTPDNVLPMFGW